MRAFTSLVLLAAITMMHNVHALPRPDLAVRQDEDDLRNQSHIFHHLDRNQRTANRDREALHRNEAERPGLSVVRRVSKGLQRSGVARERVVEKRFIRSPDYSESDGARGGSNSASSAPGAMATPQPGPAAKEERPQATRMGDP